MRRAAILPAPEDSAFEDVVERAAALPEFGARLEVREALAACRAGDTSALIDLAARLVEHCERSEREAIAAETQLVAAREVSAALASAGETALPALARYLRGALRVPQLLLARADWPAGVLRVHAAGVGTDPHEAVIPISASSGALAVATLTGEAIAVAEPVEMALVAGPAFESLGLAGAPYAVVPLPSGAEAASDRTPPVAGALALVGSNDDPTCPARRLALAESLAMAVGTALENARLERTLERERAFLAELVGGLPLGLIATDAAGRVLRMNAAAERLAGRAASACLGRPLEAALGWSVAETARAMDTAADGEVRDAVLRRPDGGSVAIGLATASFHEADGAAGGRIVSFADLSDVKRLEEEVRALDRLAVLGRFASSVAHEVRNPLAGIAAGVQYLARRLPPGDAASEHIDFLLAETARLDRIVDGLLRATRGTQASARADGQRPPLPLVPIVERALALAAPAAEGRGVPLAADLDAMDAPVDPDGLEQALVNILANAIEASPRGAAVRLTLQRAAPPDASAVVRVADEGTGIPAEDLGRVFDPFFTTRPGGTGLGLFIAHGAIRASGGTLTLQSTPGAGTVAEIRLPLTLRGTAS